FIVMVAEGIGHSEELAKEIEAKTGVESRATVLGHIQRGVEMRNYDIQLFHGKIA
ncbi:MAG: 6-phosphofructokinase, partial [Clostridia bacterium]|nr:6-phosphofructokinase [Clostridia bacterium]